MNFKYNLQGQEIVCEVKLSKRAKYVSLVIITDGKIRIVWPNNIFSPKINLQKIKKIIIEKQDWILQAFQKQNKLKSLPSASQGNYLKYKQQAHSFVISKLEHYNQVYNFSFQKIRIRNQKTRWGSCSQQKNLNFNFRLIFLPTDLVDYLIVHELCHLQEMNHGPRFWQLIAETIPDYKARRKELRKYNLSV